MCFLSMYQQYHLLCVDALQDGRSTESPMKNVDGIVGGRGGALEALE